MQWHSGSRMASSSSVLRETCADQSLVHHSPCDHQIPGRTRKQAYSVNGPVTRVDSFGIRNCWPAIFSIRNAGGRWAIRIPRRVDVTGSLDSIAFEIVSYGVLHCKFGAAEADAPAKTAHLKEVRCRMGACTGPDPSRRCPAQ